MEVVRLHPDHVLRIHPALPWKNDTQFALASGTVTARGCRRSSSKSGTHRDIVFRVRGVPDGGQTIDLGQAAGRDINAWLTAMEGYDDGQMPLSPGSAENAPHDDECMRYWLDPRSASTKMVGYMIDMGTRPVSARRESARYPL